MWHSIDLEEQCAAEKVEWLEMTVRAHVPAASSKRTPNLLLCTLPMSDCATFPGAPPNSCRSSRCCLLKLYTRVERLSLA